MLTTPMDVLKSFPVRKSNRQKQAFRDAVQSYVNSLGYACSIEKGSFGSRNVIIGYPETAEYLVTAHYDTCARMIVPNLITPRNLVAFILYQLFVVLIVFLPASILAYLVDLLTDNYDLAFSIWYALIWVDLIVMMIGPSNKHNANDNTSGVVTVLETAKNLPEELRGKVCFVLFDLEEVGLIGSSSYQSKHKKHTKNQLVLNLDCVGDGNEIMMFPTKKVKKDEAKMDALRGICGSWCEKSFGLSEKGFSVYPSDQTSFPYGVGIAAFNRNKWVGLYCSRIHTPRDTILEEENVSILRDQLIALIGHAAQ